MKNWTKRDWVIYGSYAVIGINLLVFAFIGGYLVRGQQLPAADQRYPLLLEAQALMDSHYLGDTPDTATLNYGLIRGLVSAYGDPYTLFNEPVQANQTADDLAGQYGGIGSVLRRNPDGELVLSPFLDSPASQAGVLEGDVLLMVDGVPITDEMSIEEIVSLVRGLEGTTVTIQVQTGDEAPRELEIERQAIEIPSVTWRVLEADPTIGLITLSRFSDRSAEEIEAALEGISAQGADKLILDLRNNHGGLLDASVEVASLFLDGGVVLYEQQRDQPEQVHQASQGGPALDQPLVVLVNRNTASASEILAGALRELGRAALIGENTFGKNSVQLIFRLSDDSSIHITHARWLTPNRTEFAGVGLQPDIEIQFDEAAHGQGFDPELDRAIEYLQNVVQ